MAGVCTRINNVANRLLGGFLDSCDNSIGSLDATRVYEDCAVWSGLHGYISTRPRYHIKIRTDPKDFQSIVILLAVRDENESTQNEKKTNCSALPDLGEYITYMPRFTT